MPTIRKLIELEVIHADNAKKLALSNKAKDRFLANMTHELRTPMTGVMGMIDLMADTKLTSEQQQYLQTADKSARYLMTVINDILDMAKLDAGKLVINQKPLDVIALTKNIASLFEVRVAQKGLSLVLKLPQVHTLPLNGDSVRISQILLNLMENALKFTDHGKITITLEVTINTQNTKLKWRLSDTGTGIAEDQLTKLFNRFEQADSSITRTTQGTGLGLAIIRDLVHLMDGKVGANSELGQGSEFWFELSLPSAVAEDINEEALPEKLKINSLHDHNQKRSTNETKTCIRILYAEDNPINRELIGRLIEREGWTGTSVNNGQEAVDAVNAGSAIFDLILMDIQMPIMDGLTALKIIKEETNGKLPIVALTANTLPKDVSLYEEAGFDAVVGKPINVIELRSEVEKLITTYK